MTKWDLLSLLAQEFALEDIRREVNRELRDIRGILRGAATEKAAPMKQGGRLKKSVSTRRNIFFSQAGRKQKIGGRR